MDASFWDNAKAFLTFGPQPLPPLEWGKKALTYFHNYNLKYASYQKTYQELLNSVGDVAHQQSFLTELGKTIISLEFTEDQVRSSMAWLADQMKGRIPTQRDYFNGLVQQAKQLSIFESIGAAGEQVTKAIEDNSQGVVATLNVAKWVLPAALLAAGLYIIYARAKFIAGTK